MEHEKVVIESQKFFSLKQGDTEPKWQTVWNLISIKDIFRKNISDKIRDCFQQALDFRYIWLKWIMYDEYTLSEKNQEKLNLLKRFAKQSEYAYVLREEKLKEFQKEYVNKPKF